MASFGLPPVRVLRPALWCAGAVSTIYVGCAAYEVHHDVRLTQAAQRHAGLPPRPVTVDGMERTRQIIAAHGGRTPPVHLPYPRVPRRYDDNDDDDDSNNKTKGSLPASPLALWARLPEPGKLMFGIVSTNVAVFALERLLPATSGLFSHVPAANTSYSLLTSSFGHVGPVHLALNMYGIVQFLPPVASSRTFAASGSHLAAFYLSAGVLSSYAYHLASVWPRPLDRVVPARGASGAVMAVVGAFGMAYPHAPLGIVLLPGSLPAEQFLLGLAAFETYGLFVGFRRLPLAHAAHLAGLALGSAYVYGRGQERVWRPLKRWTFAQMRRLSVV